METIKKDLPAGKTVKAFDAVKMMREIRNKISHETQNITFEELKAYIHNKLAAGKTNLPGKISK